MKFQAPAIQNMIHQLHPGAAPICSWNWEPVENPHQKPVQRLSFQPYTPPSSDKDPKN